jgi:hypothetical protein
MWLLISSYMRHRPEGLKEIVSGAMHSWGTEHANCYEGDEWQAIRDEMLHSIEELLDDYRDVYSVIPPGHGLEK